MLNLPNFLTILRIVAVPVFLIFLTDGRVGAALVVFVLAGITDSLDGAIARLTNSRTTLGAYMDPLADKMLILSAFVVFASMDVVPRWLTVVVISRDVIILVGYLSLFLLTQQLMEIRPSAISKAATFLHLATGDWLQTGATCNSTAPMSVPSPPLTMPATMTVRAKPR